MAPSVLFVVAALQILFAPFALTQTDDSLPPPCVYCAYEGHAFNPDYTFAPEDVPLRCDIVVYGHYLFDGTPDEEDESSITSIVQEAAKVVYVLLGFDGDAKWNDVFADADNTLVGPLEDYINSLAISGVILESTNIYGSNTTADFACQISTFAAKLKADLPGLKVGMMVDGYRCDDYGNTTKFDFTATNDQIDFYVVDATTAGFECNADSAIAGRFPITTDTDGVASLEDICLATAASAMDQCKVVIGLNIGVTKTDVAAGTGTPTTYPIYCTDPRDDPNILWCADSTQLFYEDATYVKPYFQGMVLMYLSCDDFGEICGCGPNPVANTYIDAWQSQDIHCCEKISGS